MTERKRAVALGEALRAMFRRLEARETTETLKATVERLDDADTVERSVGEPQPELAPKAGRSG
jgi:hypothetical protein